MSRRSTLLWITALLLLAAAVRFYDLARIPAGFSDEEFDSLRISETVRGGQFGVFYNVQKGPDAGREGLFPALEALTTGFVGNGLWAYRIAPSFLGLLGVALTYAAARRLVSPFGAFVAALTMAVGLWPVLLSRLVLPQTLMVPIGATTLWLLARVAYIRPGGADPPLLPRTRTYTALGLTLALAVYAHWSGVLIWPLALAFAFYLWRSNQPVVQRAVNYAGFALLVALILGIPYLTTTLRLPGLSGPAALWLQRPPDVGVLLTRTRDLLVSLLGGDGSALIILLPTVTVLAIGIGSVVRGWRQPGAALVLLALVFGVLPAIWTGRGDFNLALAFPAGAILIGVGATVLIERVQANPTPRVIGLAAALTGVVLLVGLNSQLFTRWPDDPQIAQQYHTDLGYVALYLDTRHDKMPTLICTPNLVGSASQPLSTPELIRMMTHRQGNVRFSDCQNAIVLAYGGQDEHVIFEAPNTLHPPVPLVLQPWLPAGAAFDLVPGAQHMALTTLNVEQPLADAIGKLTLGAVNWPPGRGSADDLVTLPVQMGDYLHFEGYSLDLTRSYNPGDFIHLVTYWRIDGSQRPDLRFFAHVLADPDTAPVIQNDTLDALPAYLSDRDIVIQSQVMQVPYPFPAGDYFLSVGAYHATDQSRVPVYDEYSQVRGDRLFLGTLHVH